MTIANRKPIFVDFSDNSGGCNGVEYGTRLFMNQVSEDTIGFTLKKSGLGKQPGCTGLSSSTTFTTYLRSLFSHRQFDGTEKLYSVSNGYLYDVSTSDGSLTSKYNMGAAANEAWSCDAYGKKFVCNGNSVVKIEDSTAYQVGIDAPTGASASASAGAGLSDGDYSVYAGYARIVDGSNVLYSAGQNLGTVTLGSGSNRISISFPNSSDPQVNNKVIWIKSTTSGELLHYFFYETDDNTTTSFIISSDSAKSTATVYEYVAADNGLPPNITFVFSFAGRLWGAINNIIYYSNDGSFSKYDIERWQAANYRITPYKITGAFSVGLNLYFNTDNGILLLPFGDINQKEILIEDRWYFWDMRTVDSWNNGVVGLTNQGVRLFDGARFTDFDLAYPIRNKIDKIYTTGGNFKPCGFVRRKDFRDEYHLMWQDIALSVSVNNTHSVLNLSSIIWADFNNYNLAWEFERISGNYAVVFESDNSLYIGQSHGYNSKVYYQTIATSQHNNVFDSDGNLLTSATDKQSYYKSRYHLQDVSGKMKFTKFYCHAINEKSFDVRIRSGDDSNKKTEWKTISASGGNPVTFPVVFPVVWKNDLAKVSRKKMPSHFWVKSVYVEVRQSANDVGFKLLQLTLFGEVETNNYL